MNNNPKKNLRRDVQILVGILEQQDNIVEGLEKLNCRVEDSLIRNKQAMDLSAFYLGQIAELLSLLTNYSKNELPFLKNIARCVNRYKKVSYYDKAARESICRVTLEVCSENCRNEVINRIKFCKVHKHGIKAQRV